jgi:hypothetical protein
MARFLKVQGVMGPTKFKAFLAQAAGVKASVYEDGEMDDPLTPEDVQQSQASNNGSLILFSDSPSTHVFDPLSRFCKNNDIRAYPGDTKTKRPEDYGKTQTLVLAPTDIAAGSIRSAMSSHPKAGNMVPFARPSTYFCLLTTRNFELAARNMAVAQQQLEAAKAVGFKKLESQKPWLTDIDAEELAAIAERMAAVNRKASEEFSLTAAESIRTTPTA